LAFAYFLKDGIRFEGVALWAGLYGLLTFVMLGYGTASAFQVFRGEYTVNLAMERSSLPLRTELPMVGPLMTLTFLALVVAVGLFALDHFKKDEKAKIWAWRLFYGTAGFEAGG